MLNVGSTHQRKNILTILKVLETLIKKGLPVRLWKVGSDFTAEQQAYIGDRQLESQITSLGYPDQETLIELYNAADLLLAPSLYEGFELTILEAIEAELEQNPIPNFKFIYFTLPFWQMGQSGQQRVKELYSWQAKGKQLCQTYQQIVER